MGNIRQPSAAWQDKAWNLLELSHEVYVSAPHFVCSAWLCSVCLMSVAWGKSSIFYPFYAWVFMRPWCKLVQPLMISLSFWFMQDSKKLKRKHDNFWHASSKEDIVIVFSEAILLPWMRPQWLQENIYAEATKVGNTVDKQKGIFQAAIPIQCWSVSNSLSFKTQARFHGASQCFMLNLTLLYLVCFSIWCCRWRFWYLGQIKMEKRTLT